LKNVKRKNLLSSRSMGITTVDAFDGKSVVKKERIPGFQDSRGQAKFSNHKELNACKNL